MRWPGWRTGPSSRIRGSGEAFCAGSSCAMRRQLSEGSSMNAPVAPILPPYRHTPLFPLGKDTTPYRKISDKGLRVETVMGKEVLVVERAALHALAEAAFTDINHLLRP